VLAEDDAPRLAQAEAIRATPTQSEPPTEPTSAASLAVAGRAHMADGDWATAYEQLSGALALEPTDLTVARDLSRVAEKLGRYPEYVQLGELCADAIAAYDPLAAAARYRHFAEILRDRLSAPDRAAVMLEKALALVPDDPDMRRELVALLGPGDDGAPRALDAWLELVRREPSDGDALRAIVSLSGSLAARAPAPARARLEELARIAASLAAFVAPGAAPAELRLAAAIAPELRDRVAVPGATGAVAHLLTLLSPWLEGIFPADLSRRGATLADRAMPPRAPALRGALAAAARALGTRPFATFLVARAGVDVALENTRPPSLVAAADVETLPPAALAFVAARALDLIVHGWTLAGKFAPRDLGILLELACRFAGGSPRPFGLPAERAGAFLAALEASVPPTVRESAAALAPDAARELTDLDPRAFAAALRRTANRVAVLYCGDPGAALAALAGAEPEPVEPARAFGIPDLRDLALFALSDPFLDLRVTVAP